MKIESIEVVNFKAIKNKKMDFSGASAIITGGNNKGKTSFLRGMIDRFHGEKPSIIVKEGEEKGINIMNLTDGAKIEWSFTDKTEKISFTTSDDIKMTSGVLSAIGHKYFGIKFDIDKFMRSSKAEVLKMVQSLLGIDLSKLDENYKEKYAERTDANRELKRIGALAKKEPETIKKPDIEAIKKQKEARVVENKKRKDNWVLENEKHQKDDVAFNKLQNERKKRREDFLNDWNVCEQFDDEESTEVAKFIDLEGMGRFYDKMEKPLELKQITTLKEPAYHEFTDIDKEIEKAYEDKAKFDTYEADYISYGNWVTDGKNARKKVDDLTADLDKISKEKLALIKEANLPSEFEMTDDGLLYKGLPIDNNQISSSAKYICALKLGALSLGKIRTMHFDASYLDNISLGEIQEWANDNDLQLLIERPALDGGTIKYEILSQ